MIILYHIDYRTGEKMRKGESRLFYDLSEVCVYVCVCVCVWCVSVCGVSVCVWCVCVCVSEYVCVCVCVCV